MKKQRVKELKLTITHFRPDLDSQAPEFKFILRKMKKAYIAGAGKKAYIREERVIDYDWTCYKCAKCSKDMNPTDRANICDECAKDILNV